MWDTRWITEYKILKVATFFFKMWVSLKLKTQRKEIKQQQQIIHILNGLVSSVTSFRFLYQVITKRSDLISYWVSGNWVKLISRVHNECWKHSKCWKVDRKENQPAELQKYKKVEQISPINKLASCKNN